jgi:hypothetical protein
MWRFSAICISTFVVVVSAPAPGRAQSPPPPGDSDEARIEDIITAGHILANEGILDSFGHVSARSVKNPDHFSCRVRCRRRLFRAPTSSRSISIASLSRPMRRV